MKIPSFGLPESAVDRFIREERERTQMYRDMLGGGAVAEAMRQATARETLLKGLDFDRPYRAIFETLERDRKAREMFSVRSALALSVAETARTIGFQSRDLFQHQKSLSSSIVDTMRAIDLNRSTVQTALAAVAAQSSLKDMIARSLGQFSIYGAIAEQMRTIDALTLRASEGVVESATALAAEMVLETQRIAEAIAAAPTDAEGTVLAGELLDSFIRFFIQMGPNTVDELRRMGLIQWFNLIIAVIGLYVALVPAQPHQSPEENAAHVELSQKFDALQQETSAFLKAEARADEAYLANLPRAELNRDATLRRTPEGVGEVVLRAEQGMALAIEKKQGKWRLVIFRDPLSEQLARAWVYSTAVTTLAAPLDETGE